MTLASRRRHRILKRGMAAVAASAVLVALLGTGIVQEHDPGLIVADRGQTTGLYTVVRAPVAGTVLSIHAAVHQYVTAGTVLIALRSAQYETALARAETASRAARAHVSASIIALAAAERAASTQVSAAVAGARALPRPVAPPGAARPSAPDLTAVTQAEQESAAAQRRLLQIANAQVADAQRTVGRDQTLLAQGLISARDAAQDNQAYQNAQAQVTSTARAAQATAGSSPQGAPRSVAGAQAALTAAQAALANAVAARDAAAQRLERDNGLLAQGAIPSNQVASDTTATSAASASVDAATAAVRVAQAQLAVAEHPAPAVRSRVSVPPPPAPSASVDRMTRRAEDAIAQAERGADALAAAQTAALNADDAVAAAKANLGKTVIRAPIDGWVTTSTAARGQAVQPGETLMALSIPGRTWVTADVTQGSLAKIRVGSPAFVTVGGDRGRVWLGWVLRIDRQARQGVAPPPGQDAIEIALDQSAQVAGPPAGLPADVAIDTRETPSPALLRSAAPDPVPTAPPQTPSVPARRVASGASPLAQIAVQKRLALARLDAESEEIRRIVGGLAATSSDTGAAVPSFLNGGFGWPILGRISSGYGWRIHPIFHTPEFHTGIDIAAAWGAPVEAAGDGTVIFTGDLAANGKLVVVDHGNGVTTAYSHLSSYNVSPGDRVQRGQVIGHIGSTGWSTGPHLFFEIRKDGQPLDPLEP